MEELVHQGMLASFRAGDGRVEFGLEKPGLSVTVCPEKMDTSKAFGN